MSSNTSYKNFSYVALGRILSNGLHAAFFIIITAIISGLVILFSPTIVMNWFPKYSDGIFSLQIIILSLVPLAVSSILNAKLQAKMSEKIGYSVLVRVGTLIGFILLLGTTFEMEGLSLAVLFSSIIYATILTVFYYKSK